MASYCNVFELPKHANRAESYLRNWLYNKWLNLAAFFISVLQLGSWPIKSTWVSYNEVAEVKGLQNLQCKIISVIFMPRPQSYFLFSLNSFVPLDSLKKCTSHKLSMFGVMFVVRGFNFMRFRFLMEEKLDYSRNPWAPDCSFLLTKVLSRGLHKNVLQSNVMAAMLVV